MTNLSLVQHLTLRLISEAHYGPITAERTAREWAELGTDRGWAEDKTVTRALECTAVGLSAASLRAVIADTPVQLGPGFGVLGGCRP